MEWVGPEMPLNPHTAQDGPPQRVTRPRCPGAEVVYRDADGVILLDLLDSRERTCGSPAPSPLEDPLTHTRCLQDQALVAHA